MKINLNPLTSQQIEILKKETNLAGISRKHDIPPESNYIYKLMRKGAKNRKSKGYIILKELMELIESFENRK